MSGIFNSFLFNNTIFNTGAGVTPPVEEVVKSGTGGIDIVKPTGLPVRRKTLTLKKPTKELTERLEQQLDDQIAITSRLAREFGENSESGHQLASVQMSLPEIEAEIGQILRKKIRTEDDEILLLLLMAACNV